MKCITYSCYAAAKKMSMKLFNYKLLEGVRPAGSTTLRKFQFLNEKSVKKMSVLKSV